MNTAYSNTGGWRDSILRNNLNDESTGTIWNAIQSTDFKNNITPVLKTTNNNANVEGNSYKTSNASSITDDKLWILSPSEMGMSVIKNYKNMYDDGCGLNCLNDTHVHYYDSDSYKNTIKSRSDNANPNDFQYWYTVYSYLYAGNTYQWWMLPAGSRKMSNGSQAYHNTDLYSYCVIANSSNPSTNTSCNNNNSYWLRSASSSSFGGDSVFSVFNSYGELYDSFFSPYSYVVLAFAF